MKSFFALALVVLLAAGGWYLLNGNSTSTGSDNNSTQQLPASTNTTPAVIASSTVPMTATIIYGPQGFSPATVTIAKGGTVTFLNQSGGQMWVASNPHPTHEGYSGTTRTEHCPDTDGIAFDQCAIGNSYSFTFEKVGSWGYHNHLNHGDAGTVVVR